MFSRRSCYRVRRHRVCTVHAVLVVSPFRAAASAIRIPNAAPCYAKRRCYQRGYVTEPSAGRSALDENVFFFFFFFQSFIDRFVCDKVTPALLHKAGGLEGFSSGLTGAAWARRLTDSPPPPNSPPADSTCNFMCDLKGSGWLLLLLLS